MKGSGKQILMGVLKELSTRKLPKKELANATNRIRAALLYHGSTAEESFRHAKVLRWANSPRVGSVRRQGLATQNGKVFLSDLLEKMFEKPGMEKFLSENFKGFSKKDFEAARWAMWCLVSAPQMFTQLLSVEAATHDEIEFEKWIVNMIDKYKYFHNLT